MKILIATKNPGKIKGAEIALNKYYKDFSIEGISVPSLVPEQPVDDDIFKGAKNRVENLEKFAKENNISADLFLAIESGISQKLGKWVIINIAVIKDKNGQLSIGTGPAFPVPDKYVDNIINKTLGTVMDEIFNQNNLNTKEGGISYLTKGKISRIDITEQAFTMALIPFLNDFWKD